MFGSDLFNGKKGANKIMQYMMMSQMMGSNKPSISMDMSPMLPMMFMMNGGMDNMFDGMFDFDDDDVVESEAE